MTTKNILPSLFFFWYCSLILTAQTPIPALGKAYQDDLIPKVFIEFSADSLAQLVHPNNLRSDHYYQALFIFDNGDKRDTVENIGFRLRGNTSRGAAKKSFKVSFNTFEKGREWKGLDKMNLNGEHNDPTVSRSKFGWDLLRSFGIPAPRCNNVEVYINDDYFGLYANVEPIDDEFVQSRFGNKDGNLFKCLYPADLDFHGNDPTGYKRISGGRRIYSLETNEEEDNYMDLVHFIDVLNNTPEENLPCELEKVFNVDSYLKVIAFDLISANWDGPIYNKNNFYLYHNTATGKFEYIPFDIDNTFGIDWFGIDWASRDIYNWSPEGATRPIYNRIMAIPEYRNRFSYYFNQFLNDYLQEETVVEYLHGRRDLLLPSIEKDPYYSLDYGFKPADFQKAFEEKLSVFHTKIGMIDYLNQRRDAALQQLELKDISPIVHATINATNANRVLVNLELLDDEMISDLEECVQSKDGNLTCSTIETATLATFTNVSVFTNTEEVAGIYYNVTDNNGNITRYPICGLLTLPNTKAVSTTLFINEILASNEATLTDEAAEYEDWVEIYNPNEAAVNLTGLYLSDNPSIPNKWAFPEVAIPAKGYLLVWADDDADQGDLHANFKLSKGGEFIGIFDKEANDFALIDGFEFGDQVTDMAFGRFPDGAPTLEPLVPTPASTNGNLTALEEVSDTNVIIFPNPTTQSFQVDLSGLNQSVKRIELKDINGKTLQVLEQIDNSKITITPAVFTTGLYLLVLEMDNGALLVRKVFVE